MHIEFVEIANFRKLLSARVDLSLKTTLFVGANNSGKTSAMVALRRFLTPRRCPFDIHDFTLCHLRALVDIGEAWLQANQSGGVAGASMYTVLKEFKPLPPRAGRDQRRRGAGLPFCL